MGFGEKIDVFFTFFWGGESRLKRSFFNILDTIEDIKSIEKFANF